MCPVYTAVFILLPSALGGIKSSWRGNRIETGKNLNPVQKIWGGGKLELLGEISPPPKMPRINTDTQAYGSLIGWNFNNRVMHAKA
jgi:hypothetical protein